MDSAPAKKKHSTSNLRKIVLVVGIGILLVVAIYFTNLKPATVSEAQLQRQNIEFLRLLLNDKNFLSNVSNLHNTLSGESVNSVSNDENKAQALTTTAWMNTLYDKDRTSSTSVTNGKWWNAEKTHENNQTKGRLYGLFDMLKIIDTHYKDISTTSTVQPTTSSFVANFISADVNDKQTQLQKSNSQTSQNTLDREASKLNDESDDSVERTFDDRKEFNEIFKNALYNQRYIKNRPHTEFQSSATTPSKTTLSNDQIYDFDGIKKEQYLRNKDGGTILTTIFQINHLHRSTTSIDNEKPDVNTLDRVASILHDATDDSVERMYSDRKELNLNIKNVFQNERNIENQPNTEFQSSTITPSISTTSKEHINYINSMKKEQFIRNKDSGTILKKILQTNHPHTNHMVNETPAINVVIVTDQGYRENKQEVVNEANNSLKDVGTYATVDKDESGNKSSIDRLTDVQKKDSLLSKSPIKPPENGYFDEIDALQNEKGVGIGNTNYTRQYQKQRTIPKYNIEENTSEIKKVPSTIKLDNAFVVPTKSSYNKLIAHPEYITIVPWNDNLIQPIKYNCVTLRVLAAFPKVCIHSETDDPDISGHMKAQGTWEFNAMRDVQLALFENKDAGLIDIGAGIGEYSLAAASLNRQVIAVEPYTVHIEPFQMSVQLNEFSDRITLLMNVVSDKHGKVSVNPSENTINEINIKPLDNSNDVHDGTTVESITLNDLTSVCTFNTAVLKIDIPGYVTKALTQSKLLFETINITHVFIHWVPRDKPLCHFLTNFFTDMGYDPLSSIFSNRKLDIKDAQLWTESIIVWKRM